MLRTVDMNVPSHLDCVSSKANRNDKWEDQDGGLSLSVVFLRARARSRSRGSLLLFDLNNYNIVVLRIKNFS